MPPGDRTSQAIKLVINSSGTHISDEFGDVSLWPSEEEQFVYGYARISQEIGGAWVVPSAAEAIPRPLSVYANLTHEYFLLERGGEHNLRFVLDGLLRGLPAEAFDRLKDFIGLSRRTLTITTDISERTLSRRGVFKPDESERIFRLGAAFQRAVEVLGRREEAQRWFTSAQKALGGASPLEYCRTHLGAREVEDLLGRMEHGILA